MKRSLLALLVVLVVAPVASLTWLGVRLAEDERATTQARFEAVIDGRLSDLASAVGRVMSDRSRRLRAAVEALPADAQGIRRLRDADPNFQQLLVLDAEARLVFPPPDGPSSETERQFLERTRGLWEGNVFARNAAEVGPEKRTHGWHIWYWGGGLNLIFWQRLADGRLVAIELDRINLLADVVAVLPGSTAEGAGQRTALLDSAGRVVYQWGQDAEPAVDAPRRAVNLPAPLKAWRLEWAGPVPATGTPASLWAALVAIALALVGIAVWFYRESSRDLRRAEQRVTFVNQVSHELKTPLTNIRMYAELLEQELFDEDERLERYVGIIVGESQRLSRLIGNILTFARQARDTLRLRRAPGEPDAVIAAVVEQHRLALEATGVAVELDLGAPEPAAVDADVLGQVLGNLLSNVEKYAPSAPVRIESRRRGATLVLVVHDGGPGIPSAHRKQVFEPFYRPSNALTDRATGTGIGLGLSRDLAVLHGGALRLVDSDEGARFEATFEAPRVDAGRSRFRTERESG